MTKPADFHVGIIEFFAVILPGAILTALLVQLTDRFPLDGVIGAPTGPTEMWIMFLVSSYVVGHLVFLVGSRLDHLYDQARRLFSPYTNESAYQCATAIKREYLQGTECDAVNTFQWTHAILTAECPALAADARARRAAGRIRVRIGQFHPQLRAAEQLPGHDRSAGPVQRAAVTHCGGPA